MSTLRELLADIDERLPNKLAEASKVRWINKEQNNLWRYIASTELYEFNTVANQYLYTLTTNIRLDEIKMVRLSCTTTIDGTEEYAKYEFAGVEQDLTGGQWFTGMGEHQLGLYPAPDVAGLRAQVTYVEYPTQLTTALLDDALKIDEEYEEVLALKCLENIAKSGNAPDVVLANNYDADYTEKFKRLRMDYYKKHQRNPKSQWCYRDGWYYG